MLKKDSRIVLMDEILSGIKALKLYAWEESFLNKVLQIRNHELKYLRRAACFNAVTEFTFTCAPFLVSIFLRAIFCENDVMMMMMMMMTLTMTMTA